MEEKKAVALGKVQKIEGELGVYELGNVVAGNKKAIMKGGVFSE